MERYFLEIMFNGAPFHGWQEQSEVITVQSEIERALNTVLSDEERVKCMGCGRTDAGVHASQFFVHFSTAQFTRLGFNFVRSMNGVLPHEIAVKRVIKVNNTAHARFQAKSRTYVYKIHAFKDPFLRGRSHWCRNKLDLDKMNEAAALLLGKRDFSCFCKAGGDTNTMDCDLREARWEEVARGQYHFRITADRFLRNMVRAVVGTMLEIGNGNWEVDRIPVILASKDRSKAGTSVPACGLYLHEVLYDYIKPQ